MNDLPRWDGLYRLYFITSDVMDGAYIGITNDCYNRWGTHKSDRKWRDDPLYVGMREYGVEAFSMRVVASFETRCPARFAEVEMMLSVLTSGGTLWNSCRSAKKIAKDRAMARERAALKLGTSK